MGKRSIKEDKSVYQLAREEAGMTREEASEAMQFVSDSRIEQYESGKSPVQPESLHHTALRGQVNLILVHACLGTV